jgi:hypothetical protein
VRFLFWLLLVVRRRFFLHCLGRLLNFRAPEDEFSSDDDPDAKLDDE